MLGKTKCIEMLINQSAGIRIRRKDDDDDDDINNNNLTRDEGQSL
jgi:hypothetical protein